MKRVNNFEITGNCVADAKLHSFSTGKQKATFSVAVNYIYETTQEGEKNPLPSSLMLRPGIRMYLT